MACEKLGNLLRWGNQVASVANLKVCMLQKHSTTITPTSENRDAILQKRKVSLQLGIVK